MAADWYLKIADKEVGPLSSQQLKAMAKKGQLGPEDLIRQGGGSSWIAAGRVKGLLAQAEAGSSDSGTVPLPRAKPLDEPVPTVAVGTPLPGPAIPMGQVPQVPMGAPIAPGTLPSGPPLPGVSGIVPPAPAAVVGRGTSGKAEVKRRKRQTNAVVFVVLVLLLVALGAGALMLGSRNTASGPSRSGNSDAKTAADEPEPPIRLEGLDELDELKGSGTAVTPAAAASADAVAEAAIAGGEGDSGWANALNASVSRGPVKVKVSAVEVGPVRFTRGTEECLTVRLELANNHETKIREYSSWSRTPGVSLVDNFENQYSLKSARLKTESIYPGNQIEEMLVFSKPVAKAKFLRLQLPALAFDESGLVRFEIPTSMIREVKEAPIAARGRRLSPAQAGQAVDDDLFQEPGEVLPPGEAPAQRPEPTISRSIAELDEEETRQGGAKPAKSHDPNAIPGAPPGKDQQPKKKPGDPEGDVSQLNEDIEALGGGDMKEKVSDFESDPKMMAEFEKLRQQQRAEQEAKKKASRKSRGG